MLQTLTIPFEPTFYGYTINVHFILEYLAFLIGFRYYVVLRKKTSDSISSSNRLSIIVGAIFGALIGSRLIGFIEYPMTEFSIEERRGLTYFNQKISYIFVIRVKKYGVKIKHV